LSLRLEMLQVARLAPAVLGAEAAGLVADFFRARQNSDGGFQDRVGRSDLYYTVFGLDGLAALQAPLLPRAPLGLVSGGGTSCITVGQNRKLADP
jgi:prenyltransferase beta subunit